MSEVEFYFKMDVNHDMTFDEIETLERIKEKLRDSEVIEWVRKDFENGNVNADSHTGGRF